MAAGGRRPQSTHGGAAAIRAPETPGGTATVAMAAAAGRNTGGVQEGLGEALGVKAYNALLKKSRLDPEGLMEMYERFKMGHGKSKARQDDGRLLAAARARAAEHPPKGLNPALRLGLVQFRAMMLTYNIRDTSAGDHLFRVFDEECAPPPAPR
mmetsp:Transcript_16882/g.53509  ORF Transcript_16882/g.53509 Transcript_16882/m.53509 type:complete len:154 (+) Transcript_16882:504-965(+)